MVAAARVADEFQIALDHSPLARGRNAVQTVRGRVCAVMYGRSGRDEAAHLAMGGDRPAKRLCGGHGLLHKAGVIDAAPVVGEAADIWRHSLKVGHLPSPLAYGQGSEGMDAHVVAATGDRVKLHLEVFKRVRHRG